jgi:hypothetical protein
VRLPANTKSSGPARTLATDLEPLSGCLDGVHGRRQIPIIVAYSPAPVSRCLPSFLKNLTANTAVS